MAFTRERYLPSPSSSDLKTGCYCRKITIYLCKNLITKCDPILPASARLKLRTADWTKPREITFCYAEIGRQSCSLLLTILMLVRSWVCCKEGWHSRQAPTARTRCVNSTYRYCIVFEAQDL